MNRVRLKIQHLLYVFRSKEFKQKPFEILFRFCVWQALKLLKITTRVNMLGLFDVLIVPERRGWRNNMGQMFVFHNAEGDDDIELLSRIVKPGNVVADIGAHCGFYSLLFSRLVGPSGHVYAYEPVQENYDMLLKNLELNRIFNVTPEKIAIGDIDYERKFFVSHNLSRSGFHGTETARIEKVRCRRLDTISFPRKLDFTKLDVEGAEGLIIRGG